MQRQSNVQYSKAMEKRGVVTACKVMQRQSKVQQSKGRVQQRNVWYCIATAKLSCALYGNGRARRSDDCLVMQWQGDVLNSWVKQRQSPVSPSSAKARCGVAAKCAVMQRKGIERLSIVSKGKALCRQVQQRRSHVQYCKGRVRFGDVQRRNGRVIY